MIKEENQIIEKPATINRIIGKIKGNKKGSTVVFFGGIHGNEKAGVNALKHVFKKIKSKDVKGTIYGISGNIKALKTNQRFIDEDLNRLWMPLQIETIHKKAQLNNEEQEVVELFKLLQTIFKEESGPFYFIDFHTTSSISLPFITINDALINRKFSKLFPVPIVLGIEEFLDGPLLSYINQLGYVSLGFEAGQHDLTTSTTNCIAFAFLTLVHTGNVEKETLLGFKEHYNILKKEAEQIKDVFEVIYQYKIEPNKDFKMLKGFKSFQNIKKGIPLAVSNNKQILSKHNAKIFMPLYQTKGDDGFFIIKIIKPFYLKLSAVLRRLRFDELLVFLPGISWINHKKGALVVNLKAAKYLAKPLFHLLGYRNKQIDKTHLRLYSREKEAKTSVYKKEAWYR
ncbi:succinylglutamate desuccinylase/aspartoacylase family protein [Sabulilitoribacter arenilitoris]|uniref:Succinylglutamate desuccinylase/aspartoacylase family protein n=1 Tax=Wocania arenilitoris TaxID=2044858 RepID=A0AAE3EPM5_9FLAO|nr:succinylglutamate desuccinylase/aspartoacylase family protein [Wocania arenilitoris]MCF7568722.1 succinylglutamate desuccinylase/aspartoacylase family protein [Wocania arenilitoris]